MAEPAAEHTVRGTALPAHEQAAYGELAAAIRENVEARLLDLCEARIDLLLGRAPWPEGVVLAPRERALLAFVEQYALDAHGVTDDMTAALHEHFAEPELAALTVAVAFFDGSARFAKALGVPADPAVAARLRAGAGAGDRPQPPTRR